jgi:S-adenosylmethionine:tRNA ribosyltransferase-isomerase
MERTKAGSAGEEPLKAQYIRSKTAAVSRQFKPPADISILDYSYHLPEDRIAWHPLPERDASKLLICEAGRIQEDKYRNLAAHLPEGTLLVFNNTRVVEARIVFQKATGAQIEIFCLEPAAEYRGMAAAMTQQGRVQWKCLIGGASKWKPGQVLSKTITIPAEPAAGRGTPAPTIVLEARWIEKLSDSFLIELSWTPPELSFAGLLHQAGLIPLPPYIHRTVEPTDSERYQTVYARYDGSVAAPTAGLHFTEAIFRSLEERHIRKAFVTLHVGAGTFLPVKAATLGQHHMHIEGIVVKQEAIAALLDALQNRRPVIAVGTTSARTIESLYWLGVRLGKNPALSPAELVVGQWDAYQLPGETGTIPALAALLDWLKKRQLAEIVTTTQLLITPGYTWRIVAGLVTNFHQPQSTLLLLIAALIGEDWREIYRYALEHDFRFLSYGDGCLLLGNPGST